LKDNGQNIKIKEENIRLLIREAMHAREMAYAPYSGYLVGAAVFVPSGRIYTGCNVENASYGLSICAERNAIHKAVSEGQRHIDAIAITGAPIGKEPSEADTMAYPCGACRQVIAEFPPGEGETLVIVAKSEEDYEVYTISELLPKTFHV